MIYCDLDGVLADFDNSYHDIFGVFPKEMTDRTNFWQKIKKVPLYWFHLKKTPDADLLLDYLKQYPFTILTGLPHIGFLKAKKEKKEWGKKHISENTPVICCLTIKKARYCKPKDILIDDWPQNIEYWEKQGGIGILHTSAQNTIEQLKKLGF